ncbi:probable mitogen-activated protein kinase hog1 [Coccomyxa sp. Obi]|nr:probable mitogen-activated protein kinase hog1 [Coccomyxa sp. Obi]
MRRMDDATKQLEQLGQEIGGVFEKPNEEVYEELSNYSKKGVWTWEELNIESWIARGHMGSIFQGCIEGSPAAIKVADYANTWSWLQDAYREVRILDHLRDEQGQAVPRKIAQGFIAGSTCYFVAPELLGETFEEALPAEHAELEQKALAALERVHARGILHRDVQPSIFLRAEQGRVVLVDFGSARLSFRESGRQWDREAVRGLWTYPYPASFFPNKRASPSTVAKLLRR